MGTPEFAVPSLDKLRMHHDVVAVITAPDKPAGRGHGMQQSAIKKYALEHGMFLLQPVNLKSTVFLAKLRSFHADLFVVVAFRMLPEMVWSMPRLGTINLHASLLPQYRGAAPIVRAIMNGEKETGLSVFRLEKEIDTGKILGTVRLAIGDEESGGSLHDRMMYSGADLLLRCVQELETGKITEIEQDPAKVSFAPKIFREDCEVHWNRPVAVVFNQIRALIPYPCAWFTYKGIPYKIHGAHRNNEESASLPPGEWLIRGNRLSIAALDGCIEITEIQPEGKRKMKASDFINGLKPDS